MKDDVSETTQITSCAVCKSVFKEKHSRLPGKR